MENKWIAGELQRLLGLVQSNYVEEAYAHYDEILDYIEQLEGDNEFLIRNYARN